MQFIPEKQPFELDWESTWDNFTYTIFRPDFFYYGVTKSLLVGLQGEQTINYPWEKSPLSPIFRAEHGLRRFIGF